MELLTRDAKVNEANIFGYVGFMARLRRNGVVAAFKTRLFGARQGIHLNLVHTISELRGCKQVSLPDGYVFVGQYPCIGNIQPFEHDMWC